MEHLIIENNDSVVKIRFNRPKSLNAFNSAMMGELKNILEEIKYDPLVKVVIISGTGRAFSAGVDLKETSAEGFQKGAEFMKLGRKISEIINNYPKVTIAQVHGYCFTGALEFMMFFDMTFCADDTQFGDTHAKWAIMPRWGMTQRLARRVGLQKAKELTFRAMKISGSEAERIGLVNRSWPVEELENEVNKVVADIVENSFEAIIGIKRLYDQGYHTTLGEGLEIELRAETRLGDTDNNIQAFESKKG
jgi:enoyl-CoA hydratase/carnithine racemase